jgi:hypothetical protein
MTVLPKEWLFSTNRPKPLAPTGQRRLRKEADIARYSWIVERVLCVVLDFTVSLVSGPDVQAR